MSRDEAGKYLQYLGCDPQVPQPVATACSLRRNKSWAVLFVLGALALVALVCTLVGPVIQDGITKAGEYRHSILKDEAEPGPAPADEPSGAPEGTEGIAEWRLILTQECGGWWAYPIMLGLEARTAE